MIVQAKQAVQALFCNEQMRLRLPVQDFSLLDVRRRSLLFARALGRRQITLLALSAGSRFDG